MELALNQKASGTQQDGAAKSVRTEGKSGDVVDGGLQQGGVVAAGGPDRYLGRDVGDGVSASLKASKGEVDTDGISGGFSGRGNACHQGDEQQECPDEFH